MRYATSAFYGNEAKERDGDGLVVLVNDCSIGVPDTAIDALRVIRCSLSFE
jgi:hypothetical protein